MSKFKLKNNVVEAIQLVDDIGNESVHGHHQIFARKGTWLVTTGDGKQSFMSDADFTEAYAPFVAEFDQKWPAGCPVVSGGSGS